MFIEKDAAWKKQVIRDELFRSLHPNGVRSKESSRKRIFGKYLMRTGQKIKVQVIRVVEEGVEDWGCEMNFIRRSCKDE